MLDWLVRVDSGRFNGVDAGAAVVWDGLIRWCGGVGQAIGSNLGGGGGRVW